MMNFTCPKCGNHRLEEVKNVTVSSTINDVGPGGDVSYGEQSNEDGEVFCYQCLDCNLCFIIILGTGKLPAR